MSSDDEDTQWFFMESKMHNYCVPQRDLLVPNPNLVAKGDDLQFTYKSKTYVGTVKSIAGDEATILEEIDQKVREKRPAVKEVPVVRRQPRKASENVKKLMAELKGGHSKAAASDKLESKRQKAREARERKKAKDRAEIAMEIEIHGEDSEEKDDSTSKSHDNDSEDSGSSDALSESSAESSDNEVISKKVKRAQDAKDAREFNKLLAKAAQPTSDGSSDVLSNGKDKKGKEDIDKREKESEKAAKLRTEMEKTDKEREDTREQEKKANEKSDKAKKDEKAAKEKREREKKEREKAEKEKKEQLKREKKAEKEKEAQKEKRLKQEIERKKAQEKSEKEETEKMKEQEKREKERAKISEKMKEKEWNKEQKRTNKEEAEWEEKDVQKREAGRSSGIDESDHEQSDEDKKMEASDSDEKEKVRSKSDSSDTGSDNSSSSSDSSPPRKKVKVGRNLTTYPGTNYKYSSSDVGVVKVHDNFDVYILDSDFYNAKKTCANQRIFVKNLLLHVYTKEAIINSTLQGYPPRGKGVDYYSKHPVPPRLHPDGATAIVQKTLQLEDDPNLKRKWRPRQLQTKLMSEMSSKIGEVTRNYKLRQAVSKKSLKKSKKKDKKKQD